MANLTAPQMIYKPADDEKGTPASKVWYTYSVKINRSNRKFETRFAHYVKTGNSKVHNFQFFTSVCIALIFFWLVKCCIGRIIR